MIKYFKRGLVLLFLVPAALMLLRGMTQVLFPGSTGEPVEAEVLSRKLMVIAATKGGTAYPKFLADLRLKPAGAEEYLWHGELTETDPSEAVDKFEKYRPGSRIQVWPLSNEYVFQPGRNERMINSGQGWIIMGCFFLVFAASAFVGTEGGGFGKRHMKKLSQEQMGGMVFLVVGVPILIGAASSLIHGARSWNAAQETTLVRAKADASALAKIAPEEIDFPEKEREKASLETLEIARWELSGKRYSAAFAALPDKLKTICVSDAPCRVLADSRNPRELMPVGNTFENFWFVPTMLAFFGGVFSAVGAFLFRIR